MVSALCALLTPASASGQTLPTAAQVAERLGIGWNIGNTMEVPGGETGWGNPAVSQKLIDGVKAAGFNAVRIPCAWDSHANASTRTIDAAWLARVKEVVDYSVGRGLYVVLNIHWDGGWLEEHPLYSYQTEVNTKQRAYWTQIANFFKSYDEHLLFAGTNEVHANYNTPTSEHIAVQQSYNQTFVDAVRATGGNNATRTLVVQTYNTSIQHGLDLFSLPKDTATGRLMVEVHFYDPYDYTINPTGSCLYWGSPYQSQSACTWGQEGYVDQQFAKVKAKWVDQGVPVIMGEYGVAKRLSLSGQQLTNHLASRQYYLKYLNAAAAKNRIKTFYWDNGVNGDKGFALFDRTSGAVVDQGVVDAIVQGSGVVTPSVKYTLTTSTSGSGTVSRNPDATSYSEGVSVLLTATPASGQEFVGWSGDASGTTNPLTVKLTANRTVTATFRPKASGGDSVTYGLTVTKEGTGSGTVTSSPSGVSCGASCSASFASGTSVTLTATADSGATFVGWGGACSGTGACTVSMTAAQSVTATFGPKDSGGDTTTRGLTVTKAGRGSGTVTSSPSGVSCGASCSASFASGTSVTLTAAADSGSTFVGWSGACSGTGACTVSMVGPQRVTAAFSTGGDAGVDPPAPSTGCAAAGGELATSLLASALVLLLLRRGALAGSTGGSPS